MINLTNLVKLEQINIINNSMHKVNLTINRKSIPDVSFISSSYQARTTSDVIIIIILLQSL